MVLEPVPQAHEPSTLESRRAAEMVKRWMKLLVISPFGSLKTVLFLPSRVWREDKQAVGQSEERSKSIRYQGISTEKPCLFWTFSPSFQTPTISRLDTRQKMGQTEHSNDAPTLHGAFGSGFGFVYGALRGRRGLKRPYARKAAPRTIIKLEGSLRAVAKR